MTNEQPDCSSFDGISTHTSLAGCDPLRLPALRNQPISTHTSLAGCDALPAFREILCGQFLLTHPSRDVTGIFQKALRGNVISTHTSLAGCDPFLLPFCFRSLISTHTSLAGCDTDHVQVKKPEIISTHTSLAGCDVDGVARYALPNEFLLTHPSRDVTSDHGKQQVAGGDFYSHIPRGM